LVIDFLFTVRQFGEPRVQISDLFVAEIRLARELGGPLEWRDGAVGVDMPQALASAATVARTTI